MVFQRKLRSVNIVHFWNNPVDWLVLGTARNNL